MSFSSHVARVARLAQTVPEDLPHDKVMARLRALDPKKHAAITFLAADTLRDALRNLGPKRRKTPD